jgi:hypothetical protein
MVNSIGCVLGYSRSRIIAENAARTAATNAAVITTRDFIRKEESIPRTKREYSEAVLML